MTYRPWRYAAEVAGAFGCAAVFVATLVEPRWFELLFDESPDGGDGSFEAALALACSLVLGLLCGRLAWRDRQRRLQDRALD